MALKNWTQITLIVVIASLVKESHTSCSISNGGRQDTLLHSGDSFYLECFCDKSTRSVKWLGPNDRVIESGGPGKETKVYTTQGQNMVSLTIDNASEVLNGKYKCVFVEPNKREYVLSYEINVFEPLSLPSNMFEQYIIEGKDSLIRCSAKGNKPTIFWYKDQEQLLSGTKYEYKEDGLIVKNASEGDAGMYRCVVSVYSTLEEIEAIITVKLQTPPKIKTLTASPQAVVKEGTPLVLDCFATGVPIPTYSWRKINTNSSKETHPPSTSLNTTNETASTGIATGQQDIGKLAFKTVTMDDDGMYECTAGNGLGIFDKQNISVQVLVAPKITSFNNITVEEGSALSVICEAIGRPMPMIYVSGPASDISPVYTVNTSVPARTIFNLTFEKIQRFHEGWYDCNATNEVDKAEASMYLKVLYKPSFQSPEEVIWTWDNSPVNLTCDYESQPAASVLWNFKGNDKLDNSPLDPMRKEKLHFLRAMLKNETKDFVTIVPFRDYFHGTYECIVKNNLGEARKAFHLKMGYKPAQITVIQVNIKDLTATSVTFEIKDLNVNATDEAPPLLGYTAEYDEDENYNITDIHINRTWAIKVPYKIDKLKPMTTYRIRFAAVNKAGSGPFGEYFSFTTLDKSAPEPPSLIQEHSGPILIPADNKILKLKAPEHNGYPIDYYAIRYCLVDDTNECIEQRIKPTTELKLDHLSPNTSYTIEMTAHNTAGNSSYVSLQIILEEEQVTLLTAETIIGIAVVVVILCILLMDIILFYTVKKGIIASCVYKKSKTTDTSKQSRDKKGLLKDNEKSVESLKRPDNGHKEFEYNKSTGVITGKHSAV